MNQGNTSAGFTLIELLVALSIFSVITVMVSTGLSAVLAYRDRIKVQQDHLHEKELAMFILEKDMTQIVQHGRKMSLLKKKADRNRPDEIQFIRTGVVNPEARSPRSTLQYIKYELIGNNLSRSISNQLYPKKDEKEENSEKKIKFQAPRTIFSNVKNLKFRFWTKEKKWVNQWGEENRKLVSQSASDTDQKAEKTSDGEKEKSQETTSQSANLTGNEKKSMLPKAIMVIIEMKDDKGGIERTFSIPIGDYNAS